MKYIASIVLIAIYWGLWATDNDIRGRVLDAETQEPLPFANIVIVGRNMGTVSNREGFFVLDESSIQPTDTIQFSYIGFESKKISARDMQGKVEIALKPSIVNLQEVAVFSRQLSAKEIIRLIKENYATNYPLPMQKQKIFLHRYENTPWPATNQIKVKKSDFVGMDARTFDEVFNLFPSDFTEYKDAIVEYYKFQNTSKLLPVEGISLEEGAMKELGLIMEEKLEEFMVDLKKTGKDDDVYYKLRSGVFATKAEFNNKDSTIEAFKYDTTHYLVHTGQIRHEIGFLFKEYASLDGKNWEFVNKPGKYRFTLEETTIYNGELVYKVSFVPDGGGLFEGNLYVSTSSYAILQMDYAFAAGKQSEKFNLLGVTHAMKYKAGRVIFEKDDKGYFVKYIYARFEEVASVDRNFSVIKKEKRFLIDKELNEIKMSAQLEFEISTEWELLVFDREEISEAEFEAIEQPKYTKFKREYVNSPEIWKNRTVIAPISELAEFTRGK